MVEVRIGLRRLAARDNEVLKGQLILQELRAVGVPARGVLFPYSVTSGRLTMSEDDFTEELVLEWTE